MLSSFTQINKNNKKITINNNPIWRIAKSSSYRYQDISREDREAILINIDSIPEFSLDLEQGYTFKERHLTIDKMYKTTKNQHGLYLAHYTETYVNENNSSLIKIHIYLDKNAQCVYVQAKKHDSLDNKTSINIFCERVAMENSNIAAKILKEFLSARRDKYLQAMQKAYLLEEELCDAIISCLRGNISFDNYAQKAHEFVELVEEINSYVDDYVDMRGQVVKNVLQTLRMKMQQNSAVQLESNVAENIEEVGDIELIFAYPQRQPKFDYEKEKEKLLKRLYNQRDQLNQVEDLLLKKDILQTIKITLLTLTFNEELIKLLTPEEQKFISQLEQQVDSYHNIAEKLFELFMEQCFTGYLDIVKKIFVHVYNKIDMNLVIYVVKKALSTPVGTEENLNVIKIMNFLYEQSPAYRMIVPLLSDVIYNDFSRNNKVNPYKVNKVKTVKISNQEWNKFKAYTKTLRVAVCNVASEDLHKFITLEKISIKDNNYQVAFFMLFKAIYINNKDLVETLLKHGILANSIGAIIIKQNKATGKYDQEHIMPIIEASCFFKCNIEFIEILYKNKAFIFRDIPFMLNFEHKTFTSLHDKRTTECVIVAQYGYTCPLMAFLESYGDLTSEHIDFFKNIFMPNVKYRDLMVILAYLSNQGYLEHNFVIIDEQENNFHVTFAYGGECLSGVCEIVRILYENLNETVQQQSIDENINVILYIASKLVSSDELYVRYKYAHLSAALFLLTLKEQQSETDFTQMFNILIKIYRLFENSNPNISMNAQEGARTIMQKVIKKLKLPDNPEGTAKEPLVIQFSQFKYKSEELLYTCEPPAGSIIDNGITKVPANYLRSLKC